MRDYTKYSFYLSLMVLTGLLGISRIPAFTAGGVKFKRANIVSDIYRYDDQTGTGGEAELTRDDLDFIRDMEDAANYAVEGMTTPEAGTVAEPAVQPASDVWDLGVSPLLPLPPLGLRPWHSTTRRLSKITRRTGT